MYDLVSTTEVARAIGVSESSVKRWCNDGLLAATTTAGGHRRLPIREVVRFVRHEQRTVCEAEILGLPKSTGQDRVSLVEAREVIIRALCDADEDRFRRTALDLYLNGHDVCAICNDVLTPVLIDLGRMWHDGTLEVFEEHRSSEFCTRLLHEFRTLLPEPGPSAPLVIGTTLESDPYTLPREMVELVFREAGWRAALIGGGLSIENLQAAIEQTNPGLCCLSLSHIPDRDAFLNAYIPFAEAMRCRRLPVIAGGRALTPDLRERMPITLFGDNFQQLRLFADTLHPQSEILSSPDSHQRAEPA